MSLRKLLNDIRETKLKEETVSGDIATVDSRLGSKPVRRAKGKQCKKHKRFNCLECTRGDKSDL